MQPEDDFMIYPTSDPETQLLMNNRMVYRLYDGTIFHLGNIKADRLVIHMSDKRQIYIKNSKVYQKKDFGKKSKAIRFNLHRIGSYYLYHFSNGHDDIGGVMLDENSKIVKHMGCPIDDYNYDIKKIEHNDRYVVVTSIDDDQIVYCRDDISPYAQAHLYPGNEVDIKK